MSLSDSELARVKAEMGYLLLGTGAEPYFDNYFAFTIIQQNLNGGALTTSATVVTASSDGGTDPVVLTLADPTGFEAYNRIVIDVDDRQEFATISAITGSDITVLLRGEHSGTYPVTVEGPETIVREILKNIRETKDKMVNMNGTGSLKSVDQDVEWYDTDGKTQFEILAEMLAYWREQLAAALGFESMWSRKRCAAQTLSVY